jgi:RND family efflux transporter MFP subunit
MSNPRIVTGVDHWREIMRRGSRKRWLKRSTTAGVLALLAAGVTGFGLTVHSIPAVVEVGPGQEPLVVATEAVQWQDGYEVTRYFVGRIEARQESDLGFELGGMVREVPVDEGDLVQAGAVVAVLDTDRLRARRRELVAARDEARARFELAELTLERLTEALELNATSRQKHDDADKARAAAVAALDRAEAAIASIDVDIAKSTLRSPFDAVVSDRYLDSGRVVDAGVPVLRLLERDRPRARIGVAGRSMAAVQQGRAVDVLVGERAIQGHVSAVLPTRDRRGRAVDVIVELDAELDGLRRGDLARLALTRPVESRGFWVPMQSLTEGTRGLWSLYTLEESEADGPTTRLLLTQVEVLHVESDRAYVRGAVHQDQRFVARGLQRVAPGMAVRDDASPPGLASHTRRDR